MAKFAKIYLNPDGLAWRSIPLNPEQGLAAVFGSLQVDGWIIHEHTLIPKTTVHHVDLIEIPDGVMMSVPTTGWIIPPSSQKPN